MIGCCDGCIVANSVPQMRDTADVLEGLDLSGSRCSLLAVVVNAWGCEQACKHSKISYIGFPLSVNATFQMRNSKQTIPEVFSVIFISCCAS